MAAVGSVLANNWASCEVIISENQSPRRPGIGSTLQPVNIFEAGNRPLQIRSLRGLRRHPPHGDVPVQLARLPVHPSGRLHQPVNFGRIHAAWIPQGIRWTRLRLRRIRPHVSTRFFASISTSSALKPWNRPGFFTSAASVRPHRVNCILQGIG